MIGTVVAALFAGFFRLRLGRWPPLLRIAAAAVSIASLGIEALYSAAAASSSGQFCTHCPSGTGWTIFVLSGIICGVILAYRLHQLRLALDTSVAVGSIFIYALVTLLACLEGDLLVWLPWIETPATLALAGFPDDSTIYFTTWSILLRKLPFLAFAASNAAHSDTIGATEYLTLTMTGISLAMSLDTKFLRQIVYANSGIDVFIGVRSDASRTDSFMSSGTLSSGGGTIRLGDVEDLDGPLFGGVAGEGNDERGKSISSAGYVGLATPQVSSTGQVQIAPPGSFEYNTGFVGASQVSSSTRWLQTAALSGLGIGLIVLVVTGQVPPFTSIVEIGEYLFAGICAVLGLGMVAVGVRYANNLVVEGCCHQKTVRLSLFEKLTDDLETAEAKEREACEAAEAKEREACEAAEAERERAPPAARGGESAPSAYHATRRGWHGKRRGKEEAEMTRLLSLLDANPEAKQKDDEARAAFCAEQAPANAVAARRLRSFFPPDARLLLSVTALESAGVGDSVARRLLRNNALVLVLTPPDEIASMHWVDLSKCSSLGLSLFELRAVVASLPAKFVTDTAKGEKREWAKGLVEALRALAEKETKDELKPADICHPSFGTVDGSGEDVCPIMGPFDPNLPLTRRPTAVRSEPMSGAAEARAAAALMTSGKSIAERSAAVVAMGVGSVPRVDRVVFSDSAGARRLRERRSTSSSGMSTESSNGKNLLAEIAMAAAARHLVQGADAATERR